jgi:hypothetical protein
MFIVIIILIAVLSVLLSFFSLWQQGKTEEISHIKKELKKKKVIFYRE